MLILPNSKVKKTYIIGAVYILSGSLLLISCDSVKKNNEPQKSDSTIAVLLTDTTNKVALESKEYVNENDYEEIIKNLNKIQTTEDQSEISSIQKWLKVEIGKIAGSEGGNLFTKSCIDYVNDAIDFNSGYDGSISEKTFNKKWKHKFDVKHSGFDHAFENGNGGWGTHIVTEATYLGKLNNGYYLNIIVIDDTVNNKEYKISRVVKVIKEKNRYYISNFISLLSDH